LQRSLQKIRWARLCHGAILTPWPPPNQAVAALAAAGTSCKEDLAGGRVVGVEEAVDEDQAWHWEVEDVRYHATADGGVEERAR
jgi:hypothetical protein